MQNITLLLIDSLAFLTLFSSLLVITSKNPVVSILFLISVFVNAAGFLMASGIGFIGISYIIIYIGAITVLMLFVIMLLNIKLSDITAAGSQYTKNLPLALAIGSLFFYEIFTIAPFTFNNVPSISALLELLTNLNGLFLSSDLSFANEVQFTINPVIADTAFSTLLQVESLGQSLYTYGAIWLFLISIILLLSMIAPIFISRKQN